MYSHLISIFYYGLFLIGLSMKIYNIYLDINMNKVIFILIIMYLRICTSLLFVLRTTHIQVVIGLLEISLESAITYNS